MKMQKKMSPAAVEDQWKVDLTNKGRTVSHENLEGDRLSACLLEVVKDVPHKGKTIVTHITPD